jgi:hypothetical protein
LSKETFEAMELELRKAVELGGLDLKITLGAGGIALW